MSHNKLNKETFLIRSENKHGSFYDYSLVEYVDQNTKVKIICPKHGLFEQTPKIHYKSCCYDCGREEQIKKARKSQEQFEKEVRELYGDKYDLSLIKYSNNKTPINVICDIHGIIEVRPDIFLQGDDCIDCRKMKTKSSDKEIFIEEAIKVYGDKDDYTNTEIISSNHKIKVRCTKHDITFTKSIQNYLKGCGCPKCSEESYSLVRTKTTEEFVRESKLVHGDKCDYTDTVYKSCRDKVEIKCNVHNVFFKQLPAIHLRGGRCRKCLSENISKSLIGRENIGVYTKSGYVQKANGREACVYLIRCWNENEEFYKIGKTFNTVEKRFKSTSICYNFEVVDTYFGEAGFIYDLENELHRKYKPYKYRPEKWFAGWTECYNLNLPIEDIWTIS